MPVRLTAANALDIIAGYDIVADGFGQFPDPLSGERCLLSGEEDAGLGRGRPVRRPVVDLQAACDGAATARPIRPIAASIPKRRRASLLPACEEAGILGALTGIIGSIQAMEVIKEMLGIGDSLAGRLLHV